MLTQIDHDPRLAWWLEEKAAAREQNPLIGYCRRIYFVRTGCKRRGGPKKGQRRKYSRGIRHEVELLKILPSGRCVTVRDLRTPGLDALAEEMVTIYLMHTLMVFSSSVSSSVLVSQFLSEAL